MLNFLGHVLVSAALLLLVANLVRDFELEDTVSALLAALVLGLANAVIRPVLLVLTFPLTVLTLGLFLFVVNAIVLKLSAAVVPGFRIEGFLPAIWAAVLLAILNVGVEMLLGPAW